MMRLQDIGEIGFIRRISQGCLIRPEGVIRAIGDDAAVFRPPGDQLSLLTTDLLLEGVHFMPEAITGHDLGHKALAVNLSDIAAMGGVARDAFVSIAVPSNCTLQYLEDIYEGMRALAVRYGVNILGGDTTRSNADLVINIAVTGLVPEHSLLLRSTARPGDVVVSTGWLGDSRAGLHLILNHIDATSPAFAALYRAHVRPRPHLHQGRFLARQRGVHAAIDVSDGLSTDLGHIVGQSRCGARVYAERLPISPHLGEFCTHFDLDPVSFALSGGEDYTLLCTIDPATVGDVIQRYEERFAAPLFVIGDITDSSGMALITTEGRSELISQTGWDHFKEGNNHDDT